MTPRIDLRQLRYFAQVVESGSQSKASRHLRVAQPALSQQMARLENEVGKPLLIRSSKGVVPTENGEALYHHAKCMLRQLDEAVQIARQDYSNVEGRVRLGLASTIVPEVGRQLLRSLREKHSGIVLSVVALHSGYLEAIAQGGQIDIAIAYKPSVASDIRFEPLVDEELFVLLPSDTTLVSACRASVTLTEVARLPLILPRPGHELRRRIDAEFERAQVSVRASVTEIDSPQLAMQYAADGGGATIQPMSAMLSANLSTGWRCLPISDVRLLLTSYLYALPVQRLSPSVSIVRSELIHAIRDLIDGGVWRGVRLSAAKATKN